VNFYDQKLSKNDQSFWVKFFSKYPKPIRAKETNQKKWKILYIKLILSYLKRERERTVTEILQMFQTVQRPWPFTVPERWMAFLSFSGLKKRSKRLMKRSQNIRITFRVCLRFKNERITVIQTYILAKKSLYRIITLTSSFR